jgi:hypothetical protein
LIWPKDGCASIAWSQWRQRDFLPLGLPPHAQARGDPGSPIPREPRKSRLCHPSLRSGPKTGAAAITFGLQIAIEAAMVAGSYS